MRYYFFFSSRRRHTRCSRDWSSDVCSSDLEAEHSLAVGQVRAWAGVLHHDRLPARQVAQRAIADPRVLEFHARRLGTAELAARLLNVSAVRLGAAGNLARVSHPPPEIGRASCRERV